MKLALNLKARSRSVARITFYNIRYVIMRAIIHCHFSQKIKIFSPKLPRRKPIVSQRKTEKSYIRYRIKFTFFVCSI